MIRIFNDIKIIRQIFLGIVLVLLFCGNNYATNLGVIGQVYPIAEEDFLVFIQHRISVMQQNGEWQALENQFKTNVQNHVVRPTPITTVTHASETKSWLFDPSITVPYDLMDAQGQVIAKAGTTINPLSMVSLHKSFLFFDGDDAKEVAWAKQVNNKLNDKTKLILVNGSIADNEKYFSKPIYFDQEARLVTKFNIHHVPAIVQQDGLFLRISEVAL